MEIVISGKMAFMFMKQAISPHNRFNGWKRQFNIHFIVLKWHYIHLKALTHFNQLATMNVQRIPKETIVALPYMYQYFIIYNTTDIIMDN